MTIRRDPVEAIIAQALTKAWVEYVREDDPRSLNLDFYLPEFDIHIECKRFHSPRISGQMARTTNIIVVQGIEAARVFAQMIEGLGAIKSKPWVKRYDSLPDYGPKNHDAEQPASPPKEI